MPSEPGSNRIASTSASGGMIGRAAAARRDQTGLRVCFGMHPRKLGIGHGLSGKHGRAAASSRPLLSSRDGGILAAGLDCCEETGEEGG